MRRLKFPRGEKGFTLIEIIITIFLLGIGLTVLIEGLALAVQNADRNRDRVTMLNLAKSQLEDVMKQTYDPIPSAYPTITPSPSRYSISISVSVPVNYTYPSPYPTPAEETVQLVEVTVTGDTGSLSISGYKVNK